MWGGGGCRYSENPGTEIRKTMNILRVAADGAEGRACAAAGVQRHNRWCHTLLASGCIAVAMIQ